MDPADWIILIIMAIVMVIGIAVSVTQNKKRKEMLILQTQKRGGEVSGEGFFRRLELRLPVRGETVVIFSRPRGKYNPPETNASLKLENPRFPDIQIKRNDLGQKLMGALGKERFLTGDEAFDTRFAITSEDAYQVQKLLTDDLKRIFMEPYFNTLEIKISPQKLYVSIKSIPETNQEYDIFIDTVLQILQKIM
jgi:hypothetical protein